MQIDTDISVAAEDDQDDSKFLANLKKMIVTANKKAEIQGYIHRDLELSAIRRVIEANSVGSVPPGAERVIGAYYERVTGRKAYY